MDYRAESTYELTRLPVELASTLLPDAYRSEAFFAEEQVQVFARGWVPIAARSEVGAPGEVVVRTLAGRSVVVTMNEDREYRGFLNVCRHRASPLVQDDCTLAAGRFRCPYHAWAYDLDGRCIGTPLFEGSGIPEDMQQAFDMGDVRAFDRADYPLFEVTVAAWGPLLLASLESTPPPLDDWLGDLGDRLAGFALEEWEVQARKDYDIHANWKLIAENYMEYYHLPWVHPELARVSRIEDHYRYQGPGMYTGMTTTPISGDDPAWMALPPHAGIAEHNRDVGRFMQLFPTATISVLPNHCFLMLMEPISAGRTLERTLLLTHPETMAPDGAGDALERLLGFWDHVNREDIAIVEGVQRGLSTPEYGGGRMCYRFEEPVHRFHNMVADRMTGLDRVPDGDAEDHVPMFGDRGSG